MKNKILNIKNYNFYTNKLQSKSATISLFLFSFVEAIFFPIPVDPYLALLVLANKKNYIKLTLICTIASVIGGIVGWVLGYYVGPEIKNFLSVLPWFDIDNFENVYETHNNHGNLIIFLGAFTPLPFKVISITSGIFKVNFFEFIFMAFLGRGSRFFLVSFIVKKFGDYGLKFLRRKTFMISSIVGIIIVIIYLLA